MSTKMENNLQIVFKNLDKEYKNPIRKKIMSNLQIEYSTFYAKLKVNNWSISDMKEINRIFKEVTNEEIYPNIEELTVTENEETPKNKLKKITA